MWLPPYGSNTGGAKQRADVGIGPYGRCRRPHQPPGPAAQSGASALRSQGMGGNWSRDHPQSAQQPRTIPQPALRLTAPFAQGSLWAENSRRRSRLAARRIVGARRGRGRHAEVVVPYGGKSRKGSPLPGFRRSCRKGVGSFFAAACTWRKIPLTERRVNRTQPLGAGSCLRQSGVRKPLCARPKAGRTG